MKHWSYETCLLTMRITVVAITIGVVALFFWLAGCTSPRVGSTSWTEHDLRQRTEAAYGPEVKRAEWGGSRQGILDK